MIDKAICFNSGNNRIAVSIHDGFKKLIITVRDEFGFQTTSFISDEQAEKLALLFMEYLKEIKKDE